MEKRNRRKDEHFRHRERREYQIPFEHPVNGCKNASNSLKVITINTRAISLSDAKQKTRPPKCKECKQRYNAI